MDKRNLRNIYENEELVKLSREQAENLLSNGIEVGKAYKLNNNENTQYLVINISNDKAMLLRINVEDDITPYIIVDKPKINNGNIEWNSGRYYKDFENATNDYVNRLNSIEVQIENPKYRLISQDELEQMKKSNIEFNARLDIENEGKYIIQYDESNIEQVEELLNGNEHNLIR